MTKASSRRIQKKTGQAFQLTENERLALDALHSKRSALSSQMEIAQRNYADAMTLLNTRQAAFLHDVSERVGIDVATLSSGYEFNPETGEVKKKGG